MSIYGKIIQILSKSYFGKVLPMYVAFPFIEKYCVIYIVVPLIHKYIFGKHYQKFCE